MKTERTHVVIADEPRVCETHGPFTAKLWELRPRPAKPSWANNMPDFLAPFWSACPTCDAALQRQVDDHDAAIKGGLTEKQRAQQERVQKAGIPPRYRHCAFTNFNHVLPGQQRELRHMRSYAMDFDGALATGRSIVLIGSTGTGKTHLAVAALHYVLSKGYTGAYTTLVDLMARIKATYSKGADETEAEVTRHYQKVDLLVLDEVGRSFATEYERTMFFTLLDRRYQHMKPTLLVSNLGKAELVEVLGEAFMDRVRHGGGAMRQFNWASQRGDQ